MATIQDYLAEAERQRALLQKKLQDKGVSALGKLKYNTLVTKVDDILQKTGVTFGTWTPTVNTSIFTISDLPFKPAKLSICCDAVLKNQITTATPIIYMGVLNVELDTLTVDTISNNQTSLLAIVNEIPVDISVEENNGLYNVTLSLEAFNETASTPYYFRASAHKWCVAAAEWLSV